MPLLMKLAKCTGCKLCQLACTAFHEKVFNPARSRIQIIHEYTEGGLHIAAKRCILCKKCEEICPAGAISNNGRWMLVDDEKCIGCKDCIRVCPQSVIFLDENRKAIICDLCGGTPQCIQWCPKSVISLREEIQ